VSARRTAPRRAGRPARRRITAALSHDERIERIAVGSAGRQNEAQSFGYRRPITSGRDSRIACVCGSYVSLDVDPRGDSTTKRCARPQTRGVSTGQASRVSAGHGCTVVRVARTVQ
jgi:hypothetical protein